ncbi:MAG TPA: hypothetical protein VM681_02220 [Candidatus Thermoplasmatota archaeon]|nr:hypothetical protein [Candidatus Thermoplasmatota archaeon]
MGRGLVAFVGPLLALAACGLLLASPSTTRVPGAALESEPVVETAPAPSWLLVDCVGVRVRSTLALDCGATHEGVDDLGRTLLLVRNASVGVQGGLAGRLDVEAIEGIVRARSAPIPGEPFAFATLRDANKTLLLDVAATAPLGQARVESAGADVDGASLRWQCDVQPMTARVEEGAGAAVARVELLRCEARLSLTERAASGPG